MNKPRKLSFSLDQVSRKKFLLFLDSILIFSKDDCSNIFTFSKINIICQNEYTSNENSNEIKAYHYYNVVINNEESNENSFKDYCMETSLNQISMLINHEELTRFRDLLKNYEYSNEYIFTAKRNEASSQYYLDVNLPMGNFLYIKEAIKFKGLKSNHDVFLFNRELCFYINFQNQMKYLLKFLKKSTQNKMKNKFLKIEISDSEVNKIDISFKLENKDKILFKNLTVNNKDNYDTTN